MTTFVLEIEGMQTQTGVLELATWELDPVYTWVKFLHDFERLLYNRDHPGTKGKPETVITYEKENRVTLSPAWDEFNKKLWCIAAFGYPDLSRFSEIEKAFYNAMGPTKVINNGKTYPDGYMPLAFGGNIGRVVGESRPNADFGPAWVIECLNGSKAPPDVENVFWNKPWLWSKATNCRYAFPDDNIQGLENPWQHVTPFPQLDAYNAHVPLMLISNTGTVQVQKVRCEIITNGMIPNPYNPAVERRFG